MILNLPDINKSSLKTNFRYDINALRALAIIGVLFFHYKVPYLSGGFSGVDIFFVISGYLMSRTILNAINKNEFSFFDFYGKRLKRIVPALLFLIIVLTVTSFFFYLPSDYMTNQKNAAGSVLFYSNILYWRNSNYFDPSSDTNILLHTWSLSVEWQFYLLYPVFLLILNKVFKRKHPYILFFIGSTALIFIFSILFTNFQPTASFYLFPTRSWEMLLGGIAFYEEGLIKNYKWRKFAAILGYTLLIACFLFLTSTMPWPGIYTFFPVLATFLIIIANYNDFKIIRHESIQFLGKISYSLYLWHWPVYVIGQYFAIKLNFGSVILFTLTSVLLGYISYKYIESVKFNNITLLIAVVVVFAGNVALSKHSFNNIVFKAKTLEIANYQENHQKDIDRQFSNGTCFTTTGIKGFNKAQCMCLIKPKRNFLLIGDSHAGDISASLKESLEKRDINLLQGMASGGLPTLNFPEKTGYFLKSKGRSLNREVMNYVYRDFIPKNSAKIEGVIISAHWAQWNDINKDQILDEIKETVNYLHKYHIKTIIIGQSEVYDLPYATIMAKDNEYNINTSNKYLDNKAYKMNDFLQKNLSKYYINIINTNSFPPLSAANIPYMFDENHFTKYGADLTVNKTLANPVVKAFLNSKSDLF